MEYCEHCERSFKTVQGLLGHYRMKHTASTAQNRAEDRPSNGQHRAEDRPGNERELLQDVREQLARLEELERASSLIDKVKVAAIEDHKHGMSDPECPRCIEVVRESLIAVEQKGVDKTVAYYDNIPGVKLLRETWEELEAERQAPEERMITIVSG